MHQLKNMIICVCRRLNEAAVNQAIDAGARAPEAVQAHHGCEFNCGRCRCAIGEMISEKMDETSEFESLVAAE